MDSANMNSRPGREAVLDALRATVIPWAQTRPGIGLVLAQTPYLSWGSVPVRRHPEPMSLEGGERRGFIRQRWWRKEGMEANRTIEMGCVLEGEADWRVWNDVLLLTERTFFIVPPGVPRPDGTRPHWERRRPERAYSRILMLVTMPSWASCHICRSEGGVHSIETRHTFLRDGHLNTLAELLMEELRRPEAAGGEMARAYLLTLLLRLRHALEAGDTAVPVGNLLEREDTGDGLPAVRRACDYIATHLNQDLSLEEIANRAYVSPSYLRRLFRAEMGTGVMQYVTRCRIESARRLLEETEVPIAHVAALVGYPHPSSFSRVFTQHTGASPVEYRDRRRNGDTLPGPDTYEAGADSQ